MNRFFCAIFSFCLLFSCSKPNAKTPVSVLTVNRSLEKKQEKEQDFPFPPLIPIAPNKRVLDIQNLNLDGSQEEEQILFLQSKTNLGLPIEIKVIAFNSALQTSYLAWEGEVLARANRPFHFSAEDLIGDHKKELVIQGQDDKGWPSIDVLRLIQSPGRLGLQYKIIFALSIQGTIDVARAPQNTNYSANEKPTNSACIITEESDPDASHVMNTIKTIYSWKYQSSQFEKIKTEYYRKDELASSQLNNLFLKENSHLEDFLSGAWMKLNLESKEGRQILFFNPEKQEIILYNEKSQEVYSWKNSSRTVRNGLYIVGKNALIPLINLQMGVTITNAQTIDVNIQNNSLWNGAFQKLDLKAFHTERSSALTQVQGPTGVYKNDQGDEFHFDLPQLTITKDGKQFFAIASVFSLNKSTVLQIRSSTKQNEASSLKNYAMTLKEEKTPNRIISTLNLCSGILTSQGWKDDLIEEIKLEKIEAKE